MLQNERILYGCRKKTQRRLSLKSLSLTGKRRSGSLNLRFAVLCGMSSGGPVCIYCNAMTAVR